MNIHILKISNLYGYFNKDIEFNKDINLLVGINGSGKTSILNLVAWILTPSLPHLCVTLFDRLELRFAHGGQEYVAEIKQGAETLVYQLRNISKDKTYHPLKIVLKVPPARLVDDEPLRQRSLQRYVNLNPDSQEAETWSFLSTTLPKPIIVGLDRNVFEGVQEQSIYEAEVLNRQTGLILSRSPLEGVKELTSKAFSIFRNRLVLLNAKLNDEILLSAFDEITPASIDELESIADITSNQIESLRLRVLDFFMDRVRVGKRHRIPKRQADSIAKIDKYFRNLKRTVRVASTSDGAKPNFLYLAYVSQFRKIKLLIDEFEEFDKKSQEYYSEIKSYLDTVNSFLTDSSKRLEFNRALGKLVFKVLDKNDTVVGDDRDISNLSSGEKQIVILFTYLKFHEESSTVFIIDEPELSLHPRWQEEFLNSVKILMPKKTQLVIATHSPIIVGPNKKYCKVLLPYNE